MSKPYFYPDTDLHCEQCGSPPAGEVVDGLGMCSECRENVSFEKWDEEEPEEVGD